MPLTFKNWLSAAAIAIAIFALYILLRPVFAGHVILTQNLHFAGLTIHYYGIIMAGGALAALALAEKLRGKFAIGQQEGADAIFWIIIFGFLGARLYHVLSSFGFYLQHPFDAFKVWNGGLSIYGAVIGGVLGLLGCLKIKKMPLAASWKYLDWLAPCLALGQAMGRFGNFFNYELFGYPTNLPWKMFVPLVFRPDQYLNSSFFHPLFLYEALASAIIAIVLVKMPAKQPYGRLFLWYILLYNTVRFALEFLRIGSTMLFGIRINAYVSLALAVAALFTIARNEHYKTA